MSQASVTSAKRLRLMAEDAIDLKIISAAVQDAVAQVGDIRFEAKARRLTLALNRFRWEAPAPRKGGERVRAALQLSGVLKVQAKRLRRTPKDAVVSLLSMDFHPQDEPGGTVVLTFAGGGELRCQVECVDAMLADVSDPWPTKGRPEHA
jgi:hypothetical protein